MLRQFSVLEKTVLGIGGDGKLSSVPVYSLNNGVFIKKASVNNLDKNTDWKVNSFIYSEDDGCKYINVGNNVWVKFVDTEDGRIVFNSNYYSDTEDYQLAVNTPLQTSTVVEIIDGSMTYSRSLNKYQQTAVFNEHGKDFNYINPDFSLTGKRYITDRGLEVAHSQRYQTAFRVSSNAYYGYDTVFVDNGLLYSNALQTPANVTPISKIIRVNSVLPDVFDGNGNSVDYKLDLGQQILSDGIYVTDKRVGYRVKENTYININSASATTLMFGSYYPENRGE
jgi:hypothetical protein